MDSSVITLSKYRLAKTKEDLRTAADNLGEGSYRASVNRSYYAVFHALRAVTALDHFDSGKHSGIIAFFNLHYVKTGEFDRSFSKLIDKTFRLREKADYEDFYTVTLEEASAQLNKAESVVSTIEEYLIGKWE